MAVGKHQSARPGTTTWITPTFIIDAVGGSDSFDLDPCAADRQPWPTARHSYTRADNGLKQRWFGRVWLNPPYTNREIVTWMGRLALHGNGTALIFARTETEFFQKHVFGAADGLLFLKGRLNFHNEDGVRGANAGAPSVMCAYGGENVERLAASDLNGEFVPLTLLGLVPVTPPTGTWREELAQFVKGFNRPVTLSELYRAFARHPKAASNPHYREKIRQTLQQGPFARKGSGQWELAT